MTPSDFFPSSAGVNGDDTHIAMLCDVAEQHARSGRMRQALELLDKAKQLAAGLSGDASDRALLRLRISHGVVQYFEVRHDAAIATLVEALSQARALGDDALVSRCAANLALTYLGATRLEDVLPPLVEAFEREAPGAHGTRYRALICLATYAQMLEMHDIAFRAYRKAADTARLDGDDLARERVIRRMACAQAISVREAAFDGRFDKEAVRQAIVGIGGALEVLNLVGSDFGRSMYQTLTAGLLTLQGEYARALELLDRYAAGITADGAANLVCLAHADRARCLLALGRIDEADAAAAAAVSAITPDAPLAAIALVHDAEAEVLAARNDAGADDARHRARAMLAQHRRGLETRAAELRLALNEHPALAAAAA